jgi:hypothetical protein
MKMDYSLNTKAAKEADNVFSRIEEKGAYFGVITRAEVLTSKKGTLGIDISFKTETGATADYLTLWTHKGNNEELPGYKAVMALMTCLSVRDIKAVSGKVEKYDRDAGQRLTVDAKIYPELMNKPIDLILRMEEYEKDDGSLKWKPVIVGVYNRDGFTASEILNKAAKPEIKERMVAALRDKPLKNGPAATPVKQVPNAGPIDPSDPFYDAKDDIPW